MQQLSFVLDTRTPAAPDVSSAAVVVTSPVCVCEDDAISLHSSSSHHVTVRKYTVPLARQGGGGYHEH